MRRPASFIIPLLAALVLALGFAATQLTRTSEAAGAILQPTTAECNPVSATVTFNWVPALGTTSQHIEYSTHDSFEPGSFTTIQVSPEQTTYSREALQYDLPNFWRVVSTTATGEEVSETRGFVPCDGPVLLWGPMDCRNFVSASVTFRWAPLASAAGYQFIEIDNGTDFAGTDLRRIGPLAPAQQETKRGGFHTDHTYYFRVVRFEPDGSQSFSQTGRFTPDCTPVVNTTLYSSDDRLVVPALGIDAPINVRDVGYGGELGVPAGAYDVVRYNFALYPYLAGVPGGDGTVLIGGHYDYYSVGAAIFWNLGALQEGDQIHYRDGGDQHTYVVDWVGSLPFDAQLNGFLDDPGSSLMLVTCGGVFDRALYGGYNNRTLVHAVLAQ